MTFRMPKHDIRRYNGINKTPAIPLLVSGWQYLIESNLTGDVIPFNWDDFAVVAFSERGDAVGAIAYSQVKHQKTLWIGLGYVEKSFRRRGYYSAMFDEVVRHAQELEYPEVRGGTNVNNDAMRAAAKTMGRVEEYVSLRFDVPPKEDK